MQFPSLRWDSSKPREVHSIREEDQGVRWVVWKLDTVLSISNAWLHANTIIFMFLFPLQWNDPITNHQDPIPSGQSSTKCINYTSQEVGFRWANESQLAMIVGQIRKSNSQLPTKISWAFFPQTLSVINLSLSPTVAYEEGNDKQQAINIPETLWLKYLPMLYWGKTSKE